MPSHADKLLQRTQTLFEVQQKENYIYTDRIFVILMLMQWIAGIIAAFLISPKAWEGSVSQTHIHVYAAIFLGGLLTVYPVLLAFLRPGSAFTRYTIAISQMLMSALLIHLSGGRIETHFHVFGSLAFLSFYRDWKVLIPATLVVAVDHWLRGVYFPQSVYGVLAASPWRWVEHAGWVAFEDFFLILLCIRQTKEMWMIAERAAKLESMNEIIEAKVRERTSELTNAKKILEEEVLERKRLESVMVQSEKMAAVGQLAGGVAHEINNPLAVILGFAQSITRRIPANDPLEQPLKTIEREALRCKNLVQDLLTFSRANKTEKELIDVAQTVEGALSLVMTQSKVMDIAVNKELAPDLPKIQANPRQVQQVILNLCSNAMDAMSSRKGTITIRVQKDSLKEKAGVRLDIEDNGQGIPAEIQSKIFNPFFTTKEVGKGTGLGLSLSYEIVQKHSGQITFESVQGKGTTFHIFLPCTNGEHHD